VGRDFGGTVVVVVSLAGDVDGARVVDDCIPVGVVAETAAEAVVVTADGEEQALASTTTKSRKAGCRRCVTDPSSDSCPRCLSRQRSSCEAESRQRVSTRDVDLDGTLDKRLRIRHDSVDRPKSIGAGRTRPDATWTEI